jgi:hypothetical protein
MLVRWGAHVVKLPEEKRWTSMCMGIAPFDCGDCPSPSWCACACHRTQKLAGALGALAENTT